MAHFDKQGKNKKAKEVIGITLGSYHEWRNLP